MTSKATHVFDNGVKVFEHHLLELQKERYRSHNVHEAEEEGIFIDLISRIRANGTYVNVGAAIGYYPLLAATMRKDIKIVAYEPLGVHRRYFEENIRLNGFRKSVFNIHKEGIYSKSGYINFRIEHYGSMIREDSTQKNLLQKLREISDNTRIRCITMQQLSSRERSGIDLLQMDIQGTEAGVLESSERLLASHAIKNFLIGTHSADIHRRCIDVLRRNGYQVYIDNYETLLQPDGILAAGCEQQ